MKKKVTAILLAGILLLSMGSVACAAKTDTAPAEPNNIAAELEALTTQKDTTGNAVNTASADTEQEAFGGADNGAFTDVAEDAYYFDSVNWAVENGITEGMGDGLFMPEATCTRAQVVTFLWRLDGETVPASEENSFTDVEAGSWYADAVLWAVEQKVTDGMGDGIFLPDGTCTRAQIVTFLWKYAGKPAVESNAENPFTDVNSDDWYADAVAWAVEQGITTGLTETTFGPEEPCTRAQIVTFLYRYDSIEAEEPSETEPAVPETSPSEPESGEDDWGGGVVEPTVPEPTETQPAETEPTPSEPDPGEEDWGGGKV